MQAVYMGTMVMTVRGKGRARDYSNNGKLGITDVLKDLVMVLIRNN